MLFADFLLRMLWPVVLFKGEKHLKLTLLVALLLSCVLQAVPAGGV